ncbi:hypothetical protein OROMI_005786 [Orobanche minor]
MRQRVKEAIEEAMLRHLRTLVTESDVLISKKRDTSMRIEPKKMNKLSEQVRNNTIVSKSDTMVKMYMSKSNLSLYLEATLANLEHLKKFLNHRVVFNGTGNNRKRCFRSAIIFDLDVVYLYFSICSLSRKEKGLAAERARSVGG